MDKEIVTNYLLAFLQQREVDLTDETAAVLVLRNKFSESDIEVSKRLLFGVLKKSNHMVARRRDEAKENAQDIVTLFKNTAPDDLPLFVAKELRQFDVRSLLKDIAHLKISLAEAQSKLKRTGVPDPPRPPPMKLIERPKVTHMRCGTSWLRERMREEKMKEVPIVSVEQGKLQGRVILTDDHTARHFYHFQGIPYAKPPLGSLRFKAPEPPEPWEGVRTATSEGNMAPQIDFFSKAYTGNEDCLFLNVYTPTLKGAALPVMIFIHGGGFSFIHGSGFSFGSGNNDLYGAEYLVARRVVVVTLNYRYGALGFLSLNTPEVPGNAGLKDIVQAIRWVKSNIHNFGGYAENITIFGESAGAAVCYLTVSPLTNKLVHKAIIQSGTALSTFSLQKTPLENARTIAKILGSDSSDPEQILEFLRTRSGEEIVDAQQKMNLPLENKNNFSLVVETDFPEVEAVITESFYDLLTSGRVADIPIMIGVCSSKKNFDLELDDLQLFISEELNIKTAEKVEESELISDRIIKIDTNMIIQHLVQAINTPIYYYNFDYVGALNICHELFQKSQRQAGHMDKLGYEDRMMRDKMVRLWTNFAKCGHPTLVEDYGPTVTWLPVAKDTQYYLNIGSELTLQSDIDKEKMEFWDNFYRKRYRIFEHRKTNTDEGPVEDDPSVIVDRIPSKVGTKVNDVIDIPVVAAALGQSTISKETTVRTNDTPDDVLPKNEVAIAHEIIQYLEADNADASSPKRRRIQSREECDDIISSDKGVGSNPV